MASSPLGIKVKYCIPLFVTNSYPNLVNCLSTNSNYLHVFLLCWEHDPCYLHLGSINTRMDVFIGCEYEFETRIAASTGIDVGFGYIWSI
jgi:hypothetical protein